MATAWRIMWRADPGRVGLALALRVASSAGPPLVALAAGWATEAVAERAFDAAAAAIVVLAVVLVLGDAANMAGFRLVMRNRETGGHALERHVLDLVAGMPGLEHFERPDYADRLHLLRTARYELAMLVDALYSNVSVLVRVSVSAVVLVLVSPWLLFLALFGLPMAWAASAATRRELALAHELAEPSRIGAHHLSMALRPETAAEVRVFGLAAELSRRYRELWRRQYERRLHVELGTRLRETAASAVFAAGYLGALALVAQRAVRGDADVGSVAVTAVLAAQVAGMLSDAVGVGTWLLRSAYAADHLAWITSESVRARVAFSPPTVAAAPRALSRGIEFEDVAFSYDGSGREAVQGVSLHLPAGAVVAFVGENGAGKSTLVKLLARFYDPTRGRILVDGVDLRCIPLDEWRARLAAALQDFVRPQFLLREAVGIGDVEHLDSEEAVRRAVTRAGAADLEGSLPAGLATQLGTAWTGGVDLSGGQWQKVALARGMMRPEPPAPPRRADRGARPAHRARTLHALRACRPCRGGAARWHYGAREPSLQYRAHGRPHRGRRGRRRRGGGHARRPHAQGRYVCRAVRVAGAGIPVTGFEARPASVAVPILSVGDLEEAAAFYARLGFVVRARHPGYLILDRAGAELHLSGHEGHDPKTTDGMAYLRVHDIEAVYESLRTGLAADGLLVLNPPGTLTAEVRAELARREAAGVPCIRVHELHDTEYGMREFAVVDPAGNLLRVGERSPTAR